MKLGGGIKNNQALTMVELIVVIVVIGFACIMLLALLLPALARSKDGRMRINCASNLKMTGLAFRIWEGDNGNRFPMQVYTNVSGAPLYLDSINAFRYFQVMSNELSDPKLLHCPEDKQRIPATNFTTDLNSSHISYFIGLDADETFPTRFLAGDSHLTTETQFNAGSMLIPTNQVVSWTRERHQGAGFVGMADGSVHQLSSSGLRQALRHTGLATNRLLMP